jgi:hypothetical protein
MAVITKEQLIERRGDLSPFLIHMTRDGSWTRYTDLHARVGDVQVLRARASLEAIIRSGTIEARSAFGYFNFKVPMIGRDGRPRNEASKVQREWLRAVCFTETPLDHVHLQMQTVVGRKLQFRPYGLALWEAAVRRGGGNPLFYFESQNRALRSGLDALAVSAACEAAKPMLPLYEAFGGPLFGRASTAAEEIDFRWEREWRVAGDFKFERAAVAFGICGEADVPYFEGLVGNTIPFVDPTGDLDFAKAKLRRSPGLKNLR